MLTLLAWFTLLAGIYSIVLCFALNTSNFISALIFKAIPFFFGVGNIIVALYLFDIIVIKI